MRNILNHKRTNNPNLKKKMTNIVNRHHTIEIIQMINNHVGKKVFHITHHQGNAD